jgi:hypothetical protein
MVEKNIFDTQLTIKYKWAHKFNIASYLVYFNSDNKGQSIFKYIRSNKGLSLLDLYFEIVKLNCSDITPQILINLYIFSNNISPNEETLKLVNNFYIKYNSLIKEEIFDEEASFKNLSTFDNVTDLIQHYNSWVNNYTLTLEKEKEIYNEIIKNEKELISIKPTPLEETIIQLKTLKYKVKTNEDGIELFNNCVPSFFVPYIQLNDINDKSFYSIYYGSSKNNDIPIFKNILLEKNKTKAKNTIYVTLDTRETKEDPIDINTYVKCIFSLNDKTFAITSPFNGIKRAKERIEKTFPDITLEEYSTTKIRGYFDVKNVIFKDYVFHYLIINDSKFYQYLYIDEKDKSRIDKLNFNVHFINSIDNKHNLIFSFSNINEVNVDGKLVDFSSYSTEIINPINKINIIKANTEESITIFKKVFSRLLSIYNDQRIKIVKQFEEIIPSLTVKIEQEKEEVKVYKQTKLKNLQSKAKDLFISGYARKSQCANQPIIIKEDEIEAWKDFTFRNKKGEICKRNVLPFPPKSPKYYFVCPSDKYPYISLYKNKLENSKEYPYYPKCTPNEINNEINNNPILYYEHLEPVAKSSFNNYIQKTTRLLLPNNTGFLPKDISNYLMSIPNYDNALFYRYGIISSKNVLIHAVLTSMQSKKYLELKSKDKKEEYAINIRKRLSDLPMNVYKQELYDYTDEEIKKQIENFDIFLDPSLYYRGLEVLFDINIYVFSLNQSREKAVETGYIEIPRFKLCYLNTFKNRKCVLLYKYITPDNEIQCDLIIQNGFKKNLELKEAVEEYNDGENDATSFNDVSPSILEIPKEVPTPKIVTKNELRYLFDTEVNKDLYETIEKISPYYVWDIQPSKNVITRFNPWSRIDYDEIFKPFKIIGQKVDTYGKTRILLLNVNISIYIPPTQPLNYGNCEIVSQLEDKNIIEIFGHPTGVNSSGLWFRILDYEYGVYIPCKVNIKTTNCPSPPIFNKKIDNPIKQLNEVKLYASILTQLIIWLWVVDKSKFEEWWKKWAHIDNTLKTNYPKEIKRKLPLIKTTEEGLNYLKNIWPSYFKENGIYLYDDLYKNIEGYMKHYEINTEGLKLSVSRYLEGLYEYESDFKSKFQSIIFTKYDTLESWVNYQIKDENKEEIVIHQKLNLSMALKTTPYIFEDVKTNKIYIIQNVKNADFERATYLINYWIENKINIGYNVKNKIQLTDNYVIYSIDKTGGLVPIKDTTGMTENSSPKFFYQFLEYSKNNYAAMIPIL